MADYQVGNILVELETKSANTINALNVTIKTLNKVNKCLTDLSKINIRNVSSKLEKMATLDFSNIVNAFEPLNEIDTSKINGVSRALNTLSKLNFDKIDFPHLYKQINQLTRIIEPFIARIEQAEPSLRAFVNALDLGKVNAQLMVAEAKVSAINTKAQSKAVLDNIKIQKGNTQLEITKKRLDNINQKASVTKNIFRNLLNLGKLYFIVNYFKRIGTGIGNMAVNATNFQETLNKFQVSMRGYYDEALEFVNEITGAFNLSTESIMNYQATFNNMLTALGSLSRETSFELSKSLTSMAIDYASLFNVSIESAMQQFQSALSGQVRSIRTTSGFDITERTLYTLYQELGGTKTMRQLSQLEKRLLIILALQRQLEETGAKSDFAKTINTTSNMLKQISETFKEIGRWAGQLMLVYINPMVEKVLGLSLAFKEMLKTLNVLNGYELPDMRTEDQKLKDNIEDTTDSVEDLEEALQDVKSVLLGFDKLNILGGNSATSIVTDDLGLITDAIGKYENSMSGVENKATKVAESILKWLGFIKNADNGLWELQESTNGTKTNLEKIKETLAGIGISVGTIVSAKYLGKIVETIKSIGAFLSEKGVLGALGQVGGKIFWIVGLIIIAISSFVKMYKENEEFNKSINQTFNGIMQSIKNIVGFTQRIYGYIEPFVTLIKEVITSDLAYAIKTILNAIDIIFSILTWNFDGLDEKFNTFFKDFGKQFEGMFKIFTEAPRKLVEFFKNLWQDATKGAQNFAFTFKDKVLKPIGNFFIGIWNVIVGFVVSAVNGVFKAINAVVGIFAGKNVIQEVEWNGVPKLANGGVINKPTMVMVGEYAGASSNPEIVTPENKMREVFVESMLPIAQAIINGDREVVNAIRNKNMSVKINGRDFYEETYDDLKSVSRRKGDKVFAR